MSLSPDMKLGWQYLFFGLTAADTKYAIIKGPSTKQRFRPKWKWRRIRGKKGGVQLHPSTEQTDHNLAR